MTSFDDNVVEDYELNLDFSAFDNDQMSLWLGSPISQDDQDVKMSSQVVSESVVHSYREGKETEAMSQVVQENQEVIKVESPDMKPLMRSCRRAQLTAVTRSPTPVSSDDDTEATLYSPSRSLTPIVKLELDSPIPSSPPIVKLRSTKQKKRAKRNSGGRYGEPRREQNMVAQKKYRDKKVHSAQLMSEYLIQIQIVVEYKSLSPKQRDARLASIIREYRAKVMALDPNLAAKQGRAIDDRARRGE